MVAKTSGSISGNYHKQMIGCANSLFVVKTHALERLRSIKSGPFCMEKELRTNCSEWQLHLKYINYYETKTIG